MALLTPPVMAIVSASFCCIQKAKGASRSAPSIQRLKRCRQIGQARAFAPYRGPEFLPGEEVQSDEDLAEFLYSRAETLYHPVGTCKMGSDLLAVVDVQLRVIGIEGLRVADASVMPSIISGHTNAPSIMIGERAADLIKGVVLTPAREAKSAEGEERLRR